MNSRKMKQSVTRELQQITLNKAWNVGNKWSDEEVETLVGMIQRDESTYQMAVTLGRSYYGIQGARSHVRFALNHQAVFSRRGKKR